jgi:hypothetical protein
LFFCFFCFLAETTKDKGGQTTKDKGGETTKDKGGETTKDKGGEMTKDKAVPCLYDFNFQIPNLRFASSKYFLLATSKIKSCVFGFK